MGGSLNTLVSRLIKHTLAPSTTRKHTESLSKTQRLPEGEAWTPHPSSCMCQVGWVK